MNNRAFIFDLDGVVVDTAKYHYQAWKQLANELGFEFEETHNERQKGVSRMESLEVVLEVGGINNLSLAEKERLAESKNSIYLKMIENLDSSNILPGIESFLIKIRKDGFKVGLGSASKSGGLIIERLGLEAMFDVIVDGKLVQKPKPDPEVFITAANLLQVVPNKCIVVEDAKAGVEAAKRAGMYCIGIGSKKYLIEADVVLDSTENLNGLIYRGLC